MIQKYKKVCLKKRDCVIASKVKHAPNKRNLLALFPQLPEEIIDKGLTLRFH